MNGVEWTNITMNDNSKLQDARYVRLLASKDVIFNLNKFEVKSNEIYEPYLESAFTKINGKVRSIFDKNFSTSASFDASPIKDESIVFDLGQTINVKNLTYAVLDTEKDYLRDAKFQISNDGESWTDVITIGDGKENDNSDINSKPVEAGYSHGDSTTIVPISHAFVRGELDTTKEARYLRILFTADYKYRWVKISEILINDGEYISTINDPTYISNPIEFEIYEPYLESAFTKINGKVRSIFDKNFSTSASFDASPIKDGSIVFDLGQTINVKNLTYAVLDTEKDYLRDAKFQISNDGESWTDVITIGDGKENDNSDINSKPVEAGYSHGDSTTIVPISHAFVRRELDTTKEARYLRILFTADYKYRWVKISEILINDGEYIPTINDPTYISDPIELEGFAPRNINDGDLTTVYKPNTNNDKIKSGSLTYRLSEKTDVKKINIVQGGNSISNAKVMVRTGYNEYGEAIWNELGILNKSLTELVNSKYDNIFEIRIDWQGIAPTIYEIVTINDYNVPDKIKSGSLTYRLSEKTDVKKINIVQGGNSISNAKVMVRTGYNEYGEAIWNELGILNKSLTELVNTKYDNIFEIRIDWQGIAPTIYEIVTINDYNVPDITDLEELVASSNKYVEENYTKASYGKFIEALEKAKDILNDLASVSQDDIDNAKLNLINSITELVNIKDLVDVINRANSIIESNVEYTEETIQALKEELNNAKTVLNNEYATQEEVDNALKALDDSIKALEEKPVEPSVDKEDPSKPSNPSGDNSDGETVKTGDIQGSKMLLFASIAIIAGIACVYFRKKKTVK